MAGAGGQRDILFVIGQLDIGGTENHLAMVAPALVRKGWRVSVYSLHGNGPVGAALRAGGVEIVRPPFERPSYRQNIALRALRLGTASGHLLTVLLRRRPAIVHFFLPAAYLIGAPLAAAALIPIRIMSRRCSNVYQASYPLLGSYERSLHASMNAVLGNSQNVICDLRDGERVPVAKLGLIYNGIDLGRYAAAPSRMQARAELGVPADDLVFVIVANLIGYKGHADLLEALVRAKPNLPERWRLLVAGRDDGIGNDLKRQCAELRIADNVYFMGQRNDVLRLFAAADVGLLCSHQEGFSNAILEGMAASLPMIATNVGGNAEAVQHNITGLIVPPKDPNRIAEALVRLAGDPDLRQRLGEAGRARAFEHFSLDRCVDGYEVLYRALLAGRSPGEFEQIRVVAK